MNRRVIIGSLIVMFAAALAWVILHPRTHEPVYQGKTLTRWLQLYKTQFKNPDSFGSRIQEPDEWQQADDAIRHMGTNAYPMLLEMMQAYDAPWKLKLIALAQKQQFIEVHHVPAAERRQLSSMALTRLAGVGMVLIGPSWTVRTKLSQAQIDQLLPTLLKILEQETTPSSNSTSPRAAAANLLGAIGPAARQAVPGLLRGITNDAQGRFACVVALGRIGAEPELVVPVLIKLLDDTNVAMRRNAVDALGYMHVLPELSVPALITALKDPDVANVQQSAVRALPRFGEAAKSAAPALLEFVKAQPRGAQFLIQLATEAIWKIDPDFAALHEAEIGRPSGF